jgi:di/tricarboxylate transporter
MMLLCAALTALISVNGAVAALLPVVVVMAVRLRMPSSQLLMPLAVAAHAGSMLALTGTPVNVIVSEASEEAGLRGFGFFEFALAGIPLLAGTVAIVVLLGERLLPHRNARVMPADLSDHGETLAALLTPVATPANMMVMQPGGYRFTDYAKLGLPLIGLYFVVSVFVVPIFWRF